MYQCIIDNTADIIMRFDAERRRTYVSPSVETALGYHPSELVGERVLSASGHGGPFIHPDDTARTAAAITSVGPGRRNARVSARIRRKDGEWVWIEGSYNHIAEDGGMLAILRDVTERKRVEARLAEANANLEAANRALREQAHRDGLTGLANRRRFDEILAEEYARARRDRLPIGLIMMDIDRFKLYNDHYGHLGGDECLRQVSRVIAGAARRPGDKIARYGGEEMVAVLPGADGSGTALVAEAMRQAVAAERIPHQASESGIVTISAGTASCVPCEGGDNPVVLIGRADRALYQAKAGGRNRVHSSQQDATVTA